MRIFFLTVFALFFLNSCGSVSQDSDTNVSGEFISDAKNYLPPKPPGYNASIKKDEDSQE